jgi:prepilin-type N-terminal cleavage/methylation domain-containing protein
MRRGFTLVEALLSLLLLGIISVALFQTLGTSIGSSNSINASNDLLREGQIAQQVITARIKESCYVYPAGQILTLAASGWSTQNAFGSGSVWTINTHPIVAMIMPPNLSNTNYQFLAYYAIPRSQYVNNATGANNPGLDVRNDTTTWMIMEYRIGLGTGAGQTCQAISTGAAVSGGDASLLVDYVSPTSPITGLFTVDPNPDANGPRWVDYNLQLQRTTLLGNSVTTVRVGANSANSNLRGRIYPQNRGVTITP